MGAQTSSGQAPTSDAGRFCFPEFAVPPRLYLRHIPPSSPTVLMHLTSQATVDLYRAASSLLLRELRLRPPGQRS